MVKCVVWDLDNTVWKGVLAEDKGVVLRPEVAEAIAVLDSRGILQSVASRNDADLALSRLRDTGLEEFFLVPQITWGAKSVSVSRIAELLDIGLDTVMFVDDDPFERAEVHGAHPQVRTVDADHIAALPQRADLRPVSITEEARRRRLMYIAQQRRRTAEESFEGPPESFMASLGLRLVLRHARTGDLARAEELTLRTNQLNTTGRTYSHRELDGMRESPDHRLLVANLSDRFGDYGTIGLVLIHTAGQLWTLKLLLVSCRVISRGVGGVILGALIAHTKESAIRLQGEFVATGRNRAMLITYRFAGFEKVSSTDDTVILEHTSPKSPAIPTYFEFDSEL
jgi:FkbH-like protein